MLRARFGIKRTAIALAALAFTFSCHLAAATAPTISADDAATSASECLIVYSLDQFPTAQGSRFVFYGNGFFINDQGYLITAAHVVSAFRNGGQPYVLVGPKNGPHRLVQANLVAADWAHDVAVLRAIPNPVTGGDGVRFLPLTAARPAAGKNLLVISLRTSDPENGSTSETPLEDRVSGKLLSFEFSAGETEGTGRELFAVSQAVVPGQSGSPVLSADSREVVGVVLGRWLRPGVISLATTAGGTTSAPGAVLPIHYAIALLHERGIAWQTIAAEPQLAQNIPAGEGNNSPPVPISMVTTPYPPQALFGGEVVLDALVDASGKIADLTVVRGQAPFLGPVLDAVRTWSFEPARVNGNAADGRISIVFQFPQSFLPPLTSPERSYGAPSEDASDRAAFPLYTREPNYPVNTVVQGSVAIYATMDPEGNISSTHVLQDLQPLTDPTLAALNLWRFAPATQGGANVESATVVVVTFRRPAVR